MSRDEPQTAEPSASDFAHFIEIFKRLDSFESSQRHIRGYGAFNPDTQPMPDPIVVQVLDWLKEKAETND